MASFATGDPKVWCTNLEVYGFVRVIGEEGLAQVHLHICEIQDGDCVVKMTYRSNDDRVGAVSQEAVGPVVHLYLHYTQNHWFPSLSRCPQFASLWTMLCYALSLSLRPGFLSCLQGGPEALS